MSYKSLRMAQFSGESTYVYYAISIELGIFFPHALDSVGSLFYYFLPTICVTSSELAGAPFQHADVLVRQHNVLAKYAFHF